MKIKLPYRKLEATAELLKCLAAKHVDDVCRICDANYNNRAKGLKLRFFSNSRFNSAEIIKDLHYHRILIKEAITPGGKIAEYYTNKTYKAKLLLATENFLSEIGVMGNDDKLIFKKGLDCINILKDDDCYLLLKVLHTDKYTPMAHLNKLISPQDKLSKIKSRLIRAKILEEDGDFDGTKAQRKAVRVNKVVVERYIDYIETFAQFIHDEKQLLT